MGELVYRARRLYQLLGMLTCTGRGLRKPPGDMVKSMAYSERHVRGNSEGSSEMSCQSVLEQGLDHLTRWFGKGPSS